MGANSRAKGTPRHLRSPLAFGKNGIPRGASGKFAKAIRLLPLRCHAVGWKVTAVFEVESATKAAFLCNHPEARSTNSPTRLALALNKAVSSAMAVVVAYCRDGMEKLSRDVNSSRLSALRPVLEFRATIVPPLRMGTQARENRPKLSAAMGKSASKANSSTLQLIQAKAPTATAASTGEEPFKFVKFQRTNREIQRHQNLVNKFQLEKGTPAFRPRINRLAGGQQARRKRSFALELRR
uniref:Uncharacterized protein n=1 Tax=Trichuris muris TaxID=70415 RepID=A0A5S6QCH9_TRIMR